jgi:pimeloyl-ACP methyl ester carboxylesterase
VLAPWLRGYSPSPTQGPFHPRAHVADLLALIDDWSPGRPVSLVGHDWGATYTHVACLTAPERIERAVTLAVPDPRTFLRQLRSPAQLRRSQYMALFQLPGAGWLVSARGFAFVDRLWRIWSPGLTLDPDLRAELHTCLAASMPAPIQFYRHTFRPTRANLALMRDRRAISSPLLQLHGARDGCVLPPTIDDQRLFTGPHKREIVPKVGHFLHIEAPVDIADRVGAWLTTTEGV